MSLTHKLLALSYTSEARLEADEYRTLAEVLDTLAFASPPCLQLHERTPLQQVGPARTFGAPASLQSDEHLSGALEAARGEVTPDERLQLNGSPLALQVDPTLLLRAPPALCVFAC